MVNSTTNKKSKKADSEPIVKFGLHIGEIIRKACDETPGMTQAKLGTMLNISPTGMSARIRNASGDIYDLIETCLALKKDLFSPIVTVIRSKGVRPKITYSDAEYDEIKLLYEDECKKNASLMRDNDLLHEYIGTLKEKIPKNIR